MTWEHLKCLRVGITRSSTRSSISNSQKQMNGGWMTIVKRFSVTALRTSAKCAYCWKRRISLRCNWKSLRKRNWNAWRAAAGAALGSEVAPKVWWQWQFRARSICIFPTFQLYFPTFPIFNFDWIDCLGVKHILYNDWITDNTIFVFLSYCRTCISSCERLVTQVSDVASTR